MNYPLDQLVIIAPILFIVMMIAFPVIGALGGWKRAAYWGGGNFIFYIVGMLIWMGCHNAVGGLIAGLIQKLMPQFEGDLTKIAASIAAPLFFILYFLLVNLFLLINYYAWFKRVVGLSKYKTVKKKAKNGTVTKTKVQVQHNYSTGYKVMSHVVGGAGMGLLMIPSTFAFTEATFFVTTSYKTRAKNSFANDVYNALVGVDKNVDWFSYYGQTKSYEDFDSLYAGLFLMNERIPNYVKPDGNPPTEELTGIDALSITLDEGLGDIIGKISTGAEVEGTEGEDIKSSVEGLAESWNSLVDTCESDIAALFGSDAATELVTDIIGVKTPTQDITINNDNIDEFIGEDGVFHEALDVFEEWKIDFHKVDVTEQAYENMVDAMVACYDLSALSDDNIEQFRGTIYTLLDILFC